MKKMPKTLKALGVIYMVLQIAVTVVIGAIFVKNHIDINDKKNENANAIEQMNSIFDNFTNNVNTPANSGNATEEFAKPEKTENFVLTFFDHEASDCTLITNGTNSMMVDTGSAENVDRVIRYLRTCRIKGISTLVITNEQAGHIGGLPKILENIRVGTLIVPNMDTDNELMKSCIELANQKGVEILQADMFLAWNVGEAQCLVLSATENVIIHMSIGSKVFLLMSDATPEEELALLKNGFNISCDVLKASDNGAAGTAAAEFLAHANPEYSILTPCEMGVNPDPETLGRLNSFSVLYRTDRNGMITVTTNGLKLNVKYEF